MFNKSHQWPKIIQAKSFVFVVVLFFFFSLFQFLRAHDFDGIDIDWEFPNERGSEIEDKANFIKLLEVRNYCNECYKCSCIKNAKLLNALYIDFILQERDSNAITLQVIEI
jgi:hypothetical protein